MCCVYIMIDYILYVRFGSFHGEEENLLRRFSTCKRTPSYSKLLPQHQYEVDLPPKEGITVRTSVGWVGVVV